MSRFVRYELRTRDVDAARAFYSDVIGTRDDLAFSTLPERAAAAGAPAHWLGHLAVDDVEREVAELGWQALGPTTRERAILRDPFGSVVALCSAMVAASSSVVWHELHTSDLERAWALYGVRRGWRDTGTIELEGVGPYRTFAWDGPSVGGMVQSVRLPAVHPHWLFYFEVPDLDAALATVGARGGKVVGPFLRSAGERVARPTRCAACDDPQGAAFGLVQRV
ncbi:VOC family protein [Sandaracinus amylolyticus]|uniref:VOC family protein n=1 Tax=Sandaracinus amylolyticus TaxID=927083 RepID=UPI001F37684E|nr:VOC family protein [Sandaracinus amylolyticus]UJR78175.1 VOC domain-containing protein [Sandaracinus amylolyticus]